MAIAVAMALALTAFVGVSSASANWFKVQVEPGKWSGSLTGKNHVLSLWGETFTCGKVAFSGETSIKTSSEVTVTPELNSCSHNGFSVGWTMNGCKFRFHPGAGPALTGSVDITGCASPMSNNTSGCITEIGNQSGLGTVTYTNSGTGVITAIANLNSITFTRSGVSCVGAKGTFNSGTYTGEWTVKGSTPEGVPAWTEVESTAAAPFTTFAAEEAPVTISGAGGSFAAFKAIAGNLTSCKSYSLKGTSANAIAEVVTVTPTFKECTVGGEAVPDGFVNAGGCSYALHGNGTFDIVGATCASSPITITRSGCVVSVGPQNGLSGTLAYKNEGSGKLRSVSVTGGSNGGLTYTAAGPSCSPQGTFSTGTINTNAKLTATNSGGAAQGISVE